MSYSVDLRIRSVQAVRERKMTIADAAIVEADGTCMVERDKSVLGCIGGCKEFNCSLSLKWQSDKRRELDSTLHIHAA